MEDSPVEYLQVNELSTHNSQFLETSDLNLFTVANLFWSGFH